MDEIIKINLVRKGKNFLTIVSHQYPNENINRKNLQTIGGGILLNVSYYLNSGKNLIMNKAENVIALMKLKSITLIPILSKSPSYFIKYQLLNKQNLKITFYI